MEPLGHWLRSHREAKPLSQEALATATKIPLRHIQAIEENLFDHLPHPVSAKGFLRLYARAVGLDEVRVIQRFEEAYTPVPPQADDGDRPSRPGSYIQTAGTGKLFSIWRVAGATGAVVALIVVGVIVTGRLNLGDLFSTAPEQVASPPALSESPTVVDVLEEMALSTPIPIVLEASPPAVTAEGEMAVDGVESLPPDQPTASVAATPAVDAVVPVARPLLLAIEAKEGTWVRVVIDGKETWDVMLKPKEKIEWQAKEMFLLTVGNAGGVSVHFDGKEMGRLGPSGKVVRDLRLTRKLSRPFSLISSFRPA